MEANEWALKAMRRMLRANTALATWAGTDEESSTRIYAASGVPPLSVITGGSSTSYRYVRIDIAADYPADLDMDDDRCESVVLQVTVVDKSDGDWASCTAGMDAINDVLMAASGSARPTLDHASLSAYDSSVLSPASGMRQPEKDVDGVVMTTKDWLVEFRLA
jgi:hypothetical protein